LPGLAALDIDPADIRSVMPALLSGSAGPARLNPLRAPWRGFGRRP
jgi:hypothetical protein